MFIHILFFLFNVLFRCVWVCVYMCVFCFFFICFFKLLFLYSSKLIVVSLQIKKKNFFCFFLCSVILLFSMYFLCISLHLVVFLYAFFSVYQSYNLGQNILDFGFHWPQAKLYLTSKIKHIVSVLPQKLLNEIKT